jgi:hypothetical protein
VRSIPGASPEPTVRAFDQIGMVFILPAPSSFAERVKLFATPDFALHQIDNKGGTLLLAGQLIDCGSELAGNRNESSRFAHEDYLLVNHAQTIHFTQP